MIAYERTIVLRSKTLASVLAANRVAAGEYDALIVDMQGSELLVLQGAIPLLRDFAYIKTRVPDFRAYAGGLRGGGYSRVPRAIRIPGDLSPRFRTAARGWRKLLRHHLREESVIPTCLTLEPTIARTW